MGQPIRISILVYGGGHFTMGVISLHVWHEEKWPLGLSS